MVCPQHVRVAAVAIAAYASGGCNLLFSLETVARDAAVSDAAELDAPDAPDAACPRSTLDTLLVADGHIVANSVQNFGAVEVVNVGVGINSIGLFRFSLATLPPGATIQGLTLRMPYAPTSDACASNCGSCAFDQSGSFSVYYMRSDWNETSMNWTTRNGTAAWSDIGASGPLDRGMQLAVGSHAGDTSTEIALPVGDLATWQAGTDLSIQVVPGAGTVMIIPAREKLGLESCLPAVPPASLQIEYCP